MEQLPKIVRGRLAASPAVEQHPDPDLLTAFMEQSVTRRERAHVEEHISLCSDCRQIVSLATADTSPLTQAGQTRVHPLRTRAWWRSPVLRWGAVAACMVAAAGLATSYFSLKKSMLSSHADIQMAQQSTPPSSAPESVTQYQAKAEPAAPVFPARKLRAAERSRKETGGAIYRLPPAGSRIANQTPATPSIASRADEYDMAAVEKKAVPLRSSGSAAKESAASAMTASRAPAPLAQKDSPKANDQLANSALGVNTSVQVSGAAPIAREETAVAGAQANKAELSKARVANGAAVKFSAKPLPQVAATTNGMLDFKTPHWTLSDKGLPQRSFDGTTWEEVQVDHKSGFRALAAQGMEVWVGGNHGLLYHTTDLGMHWSSVVPVFGDQTLSADIVGIEFPNPQHGRLITGDGQSWVTADSGKTWTKQ